MSASVDAIQAITDLQTQVADIVRFLHAQGWTPATSSNFSCRVADDASGFSISVSGLDKGCFTAENFMRVDYTGKSLHGDALRPSAETLLHSVVYRLYPGMQAVLHTHSVNGTVLSKLYETEQGLWLRDFEILKAFEGIKTHECDLWLPVFSNAQDMSVLSSVVEAELKRHSNVYGFLLAGHGLYTWGETPAQAKRHVEAFEFLFECILRLKAHGYAHDSR